MYYWPKIGNIDLGISLHFIENVNNIWKIQNSLKSH